MKKLFILILLVFCVNNLSFSQHKFTIQNKKQSDKIKFKLINNLIVFPVEINGVTLSFILDTGVSRPLIFNSLNVSDTLKIKNAEKISLRGLGGGESIEAFKSKNNVLKIGDAIKLNQELYAIEGINLSFSSRLGISVHGIIGYDLFKDLIVEINYTSKYIRLTEPKKFEYKKCRKCEYLNLEFYNNKPYVTAEVVLEEKKIPVKLLIDSGSSDALWLFEDDSLGIIPSNKFFNDFLGHSLSGSVYGKRSKVDAFLLKSFEIKGSNVAFPEALSVAFAKHVKDRNGSIGANMLKRFNVVIDYKFAIIRLKKNSYFNEAFNYNKSGIELEYDGQRLVKERRHFKNKSEVRESEAASSSDGVIVEQQYKLVLKPSYTIVELRKGSPAERVGLMIGDVVLSINGKSAYHYNLQQLTHMFYAREGKHIKLRVDRNGELLTFNFQLEDVLK
ncbi:aspartyl protease family protein [Thalassobellus citreus]|uniref:retropepsin-like aspartic protease n=1 Tax=Thalassobellus citreus TaxID=3367752 RepID=UPI0037A9BFAE